MSKDKVFMQGLVVETPTYIEAFKLEKEKVKVKASQGSVDTTKSVIKVEEKNYPKSFVSFDWLKAAAATYDLSRDINDYVLIPVPVITSDVPNRNCQSFALPDLLSFSPDYGCMLYQTFIGKPTHIDHQNTVLNKAKGVNLDASILPVKKYGLGKVMVLSAFDRTKDADLVKDIMKGNRNSYSMGALAGYFICSVCDGILGPAVKRTCTCLGTEFQDLRTLGKVVEGKLHYHTAKEFCFIENSSVLSPADVTAVGKPF